MVYLPEHTVDLDTGAIVQAQVLAGDHRDSEDLSERVIEAVVSVQAAQGVTDPEALPQTLTADKGYFSLEEIGRLQELTLQDRDQRPTPGPAAVGQTRARTAPDPDPSAAFGEQPVWQKASEKTRPAH